MSIERSFLRYRNRLEKIFGKRNGDRDGKGRKKIPTRQNKVLLEPLEPRLLLSSDLTYTAAADTAVDLTLRLQKVGDVDTLQVVNNEDTNPATQILASQALADTSAVVITGAEQEDRLKIDFDFNTLLDPLPISFSGGEGEDTLDFSAIQDDLLFINRQTGDITITNGEFTVNEDGTVSAAGETSNTAGKDVENLVGGQGNNTYVFEDGAALAGTIDGGTGGNNTLDYSAYSSSNPVLADLSAGTATGTAGISHIDNVIGGAGDDILTGIEGDNILSGGSGNDTLSGLGGEDILAGDEGDDALIGPATGNTWDITGANEGSLNNTAEFSGIENLIGAANNQDGFVFFADGSLSGTVRGGDGGSDGLIVEDPAEEGPFTVINPHSSGAGTVTLYEKTITYAGMEPVVDTRLADDVVIHGSIYDDVFVLEDKDASTPGEMQIRSTTGDFFDAATASFVNAISFANPATTLTILLGEGEDSLTIDAFDPGFSAAILYEGGGGFDTLNGEEETNTWGISGENSGSLNTEITFNGTENLTGGSGQDDFVFAEGADVDGIIDGGSGGYDTADYSGASSDVTVDLSRYLDNIDAVKGGAGSDTLIPLPDFTTWNITSMGGGNVVVRNDDGTLIADVSFTGFENLKGLAGNDTFVFADGMSVAGTIDGGGGTNTLDYSAYTGANRVTVNLGTGGATGASNVINNQSILGGAGNNDTLIGPNTDTTWNIRGANSGDVNGTLFSRFENLTGSPSKDGFIFYAGGSVAGTIAGGTGLTDSFAVEDPSRPGAFMAIVPGATGEGTLNLEDIYDDDLRTILYSGMEPGVSVDTTDPLNIKVNTCILGEDLILEPGPVATQLQLRYVNSVTSLVQFYNVTLQEAGDFQVFDIPSLGSISINLGGGDDKLTISSIDTHGSALTVEGGEGNDSVTFGGSLSSGGGEIKVNAENITVNSDVVVSTRHADGDQTTAPSIGDSGHLTFNGQTITVNNGAELLTFDTRPSGTVSTGVPAGIHNVSSPAAKWSSSTTFLDVAEDEAASSGGGQGLTVDVVTDAAGNPTVVLNKRGTSYADGEMITIRPPDAVGDPVTFDVNGLLGGGGDIRFTANGHDFLIWGTSSAGIQLNGATLKGRVVDLRTDANNDVIFDGEKNLGELATESALDFLGNFRPLVGLTKVKSTADILVGSGTLIESDADVFLSAHANSEANTFVLGFGAGVAYARSEADATLTVQGGALINAAGTVFIGTQTDNAISASVSTTIIGKIPFHVAVAVTEAYSHARTTIESGAVVTGGRNVDVSAISQKKLTSSASGGGDKDYLSAGVVVALSDATADAVVNGEVTSTNGNVTVIALASSVKNITKAQAISGNTWFAKAPAWLSDTTPLKIATAFGDKIGLTGWLKGKVTKVIEKIKTDKGSEAQIERSTLSAAVAVAEHRNYANASIGSGAVVKTDGSVSVDAVAYDVPDVTAMSAIGASTDKVKKKAEKEGDPGQGEQNQFTHRNYSLSAAVPLGKYTNESRAVIDSGAAVDAGGTIEVDAHTYIPYYPIWEKIKTLYVNSGLSDWNDILQAAALADIGANSFVTTWALSVAEGKNAGIAGSASLVQFDTISNARIGEGAKINQNPDYSADPGDVTVKAKSEVEAVNLVGNFARVRQKINLKIEDKRPKNTDESKEGSRFAGAGGSFGGFYYTNTTTAAIESGALVNADNLTVDAKTITKIISIGLAGGGPLHEGETAKWAISGAVTLLDMNNITLAKIDDGAVIKTDGTTNVTALDDTLDINFAGGIVVGRSLGFGITAGINLIDRDTRAFIGNRDAALGREEFAPNTGVNSVNDTIDLGYNHGFANGQQVFYSNGGGGSMGGLSDAEAYYVNVVNSRSLKLARSVEEANEAPVTFFSSAAIDDAEGAETINLGYNHGYQTGDPAVYRNGDGGSIGGLVDGQTYYVVRISDTTVQLAKWMGDAFSETPVPVNLDLALGGAGTTGHSLRLDLDSSIGSGSSHSLGIGFDPSAAVSNAEGSIHLGYNHGFATGQKVTYSHGGGGSIGGLQNKETYYVIVVDPTTIRLAESQWKALEGTWIELDSSASEGTSHAIGACFQAMPVVDGNADTVRFEGAHGLTDGQAIVYDSGGGTAIGGLTSGDTYYVIRLDAQTIKLARTAGGEALALGPSAATGTGHRFFEPDDVNGSLSSGGKTTVSAENKGLMINATLAASKTGDKPSSKDDKNGKEAKGKGGTYGVALSGSASANTVFDTTKAYIADSIITQSNGLDVKATESTLIIAVSGAGALSTNQKGTFGLAGAVTVNWIDNETSAYIHNSILRNIGALTAKSDATGRIIGIAAGLSGATRGTGIAGSVGVNLIFGDTDAYVDAGSDISGATSVSITAKDTSSIITVAGAFAYGGKAGVGAGVAVNYIDCSTDAYIADSDLIAGGTLTLSAENDPDILAVAAAIGVSKGSMAGAVSVSVNLISNDAHTHILGTKTDDGISASGISLTAKDTSDINVYAGGIAIALGRSGGEEEKDKKKEEKKSSAFTLGVSIAVNDIDNDLYATIDAAKVDSAGNVELTATSTPSIYALTIAGALGVAGGQEKGFSFAGAGAGSGNTINNTVEAAIKNGSTVTTAGAGLIKLNASDKSTITADAGGVGIAVAAGQGSGTALSAGISIAINDIENQIHAVIDDSTVTSAGSIELKATSTATIDSLTIGGAVSVGASSQKTGFAFSGAGAGSGNTIKNSMEAAIKNGSTVTTTGSGAVRLTATDASAIIADAGGVGIAVGASGQGTGGALSIGVSIADNVIENKARAYIDGSTVTAAGNIELTAVSAAKIDALTIAGAVGVGASATKGGYAGAGAGAASYNDVKNTVEAYIKNVESVKTTGGSLKLTAIDGLSLFDAPGLQPTDYQNDGKLPATWRAAFVAQQITLSSDVMVTVRATGREWLVKDNDKGETYLIKKEQDSYKVLKPTVITADGGGVAIGVGASTTKTSGALSIGVSMADNYIHNTIKAYIDNSGLANPGATSVSAAGDIILSATSMAEIDSLTIGGAIAVGASGGGSGFAGAGSGAAAYNKIENTIESYIKGVGSISITSAAGDLALTATDSAAILANAVGASIAVGASGSSTGGALSIGVSIAHNTIANKAKAYIDNAALAAPDNKIALTSGDVALRATSMDTIDALSIAATIGVGAASQTGVALSGGGSESTNIILSNTNAYILGADLEIKGDVALEARNTSDITAEVITGSLSVGAGGTTGVAASVGASLARNLIGWDADGNNNPVEVQAYLMNSSLDTEGDLVLSALASETIDAVVVAGSVAISGAGTTGVGLSGSGADGKNKIATKVKAFIDGDEATEIVIVAHSISLTAQDFSAITADVGAGSLAASFAGTVGVSLSIGVALAENNIMNQVEAYIDNADNVTATDGSITLQALEGAAIDALSVAASLAASFSGGVGVALSGAGSETTNNIANIVKAYIADSKATTNASFDYTQQDIAAEIVNGDRVGLDNGRIYEYVGEDPLAGEVDLGAQDYTDAALWKMIVYTQEDSPGQLIKGDRVRIEGGDIYEYVGRAPLIGPIDLGIQTYTDAALWKPINDIIVDALSISTVTALGGAASAAVSGGQVAAAGSVGVGLLDNFIANQVTAYLQDSTVTSADDILVRAKATDTIDAVGFSGSVALAGGPGGALSGSGVEVTNILMNEVNAYLSDTVATAADDIDVQAVSDSHVVKSEAIGVAVAGSLGAASVGASIVDNQIRNTVQAYVMDLDPYDYTVQENSEGMSAGKRVRLDNREIYEYVGETVTGAVDLAAQDYADTAQWRRTPPTNLNAGGNISILADVVRARMSDVTATTVSVTVGVVGLSGGGIDISNTIANNVNAYISGPVVVTADGDVSVVARENAYIIGDATAVSVSVSLGAGLGVALVHNEVSSSVQAWVSGAAVTSDNTLIHADSMAEVAKTVSCGVSGSLALGAQGNEATANIGTLVKAFGENARLISTRDVAIQATSNNIANTKANGGAFGAIAVGAMVSDVNLGKGHEVYEVEAAAGTGTTVRARTLSIMASSSDDLLAVSIAGGGGVVAAAGAESDVTSDQATLARIGAGARIEVGGLVMNSLNTQGIDSSADSCAFALAAGSGAGVSNTITTKANADIGAGATVNAGNILINAKNQLTKDEYKDRSNLYSGSASLGNVSVLLSETAIGKTIDGQYHPFESVVTIGTGAKLTVEGDNQNPGILKIEALNKIAAFDSVRIESVSGFGVSTGISRVESDTLAAINLNNAVLESKAGDVYLTARTNSTVSSSANLFVATALTGGAGAEATTTTKAANEINVNNGTIKGSDVHLYAGRDSSGVPNLINAFANVELTAMSMLPNIAVPIPTADIEETNTVSILGTSGIQALEDVNLITDKGIAVRQTDGLALSLSMVPYGFPIPGYGDFTSTNGVNVDTQARIEAGINNQAILMIRPVTLMGAQNIDPARLEASPAERILTEAEKLAEGISSDAQYEYCALNAQEISFMVYTGTVIQVVDNGTGKPVAGSGEIDALYRFKLEGDEPSRIFPDKENYDDTSRWEKIVIAYDLGTTTTANLLQKGQIVKKAEGELYRYLGGNRVGVDLTGEDYTDVEKWGQIGPDIYRSDVTIASQGVLKNKFYAIKPTIIDTPTLTLQNVGDLLLAQRKKILDWIASHSSNAEAVARYEIELAVLEETLAELGLMDVIEDAQTGETAQAANEGLDVLFVELPSIYAAPGSIFIEADPAYQSAFVPLVDNQLVARAGAKISVFNETPFTMTISDLVIRDTKKVTIFNGEFTVLSPGNIYFNNTGLTAIQDVPMKKISVTQDSLSRNSADYDLSVDILPGKIGQDIYILGGVVNEVGDVAILNNKGSITVSGEIRAENVDIDAAQDFTLNTEDWFHVMDPRQYPGLDVYRDQVFDQTGPNALKEYPQNPFTGKVDPWDGAVLSQGRIAVTARYLNINGVIQSGVQTITLYVDESFAPGGATSFLDDDGKPIKGIDFGTDKVPVDGYFDAQKQAIVINEIVPKGGRIDLAGQILSTGNGQLRVAHGYTSVDIQNDSPYDLILNRIDTTTQRDGLITITDTARLQKVTYEVDGEQIKETFYQGTFSQGVPNVSSRIDYEEVSSEPYGLGAPLQYEPREGLQYLWTEGQEKTTVVVTYYKKRSFNLIGFNWDALAKDENYEWRTVTYRDAVPLLESEILTVEPTYVEQASSPEQWVTLQTGQTVKTYDNVDKVYRVYMYQGPEAQIDLIQADYTDTTKWVEAVERPAYVERPGYTDEDAYTIQYELRKDTDVELIKDVSIIKVVADTNGVLYAQSGVLGGDVNHRYLYIGENAELVLREQNYKDINYWQDITSDPNYSASPTTYDSSFLNYSYDVQRWTTGGGWMRYKTVHLLTTQITGQKDYYTHTLEADRPIDVKFLQGSASPEINIRTQQDLYVQGTITSPKEGSVSLFASGSVIFLDTAAVLGVNPAIQAGDSVRINVEGGKAPGSGSALMALSSGSEAQGLSITSGGDIDIRVVFNPEGNQSSTLIVGRILSTGGNVILHGGDGIQAGDENSLIMGNQIELYTREGDIGSEALPLRVDSDLLGSGGVAARAVGGIYIHEMAGDLKLSQPQSWEGVQASIYSEQGDVVLEAVDGAILDAYYEEFRPRTQGEANALDQKLQLTGEQAQAAAEASIRAEENTQTQLYHAYWEIYRNARPSAVSRELSVATIDAAQNEITFSEPHGLHEGDQVFFSLHGEGAHMPYSNLEKDSAYYVVVKNETTIQLALSRYDAAISENEIVLDIKIEGADDVVLYRGQGDQGDFSNAYLQEFAYSTGPLQQAPSTLEERYQKVHETYGGGAYDPNFIYKVSEQEREARIANRTFSSGALRYQISPSLFNFLYPDAEGGGGEAPAETPNIIANHVTLRAGGVNGRVGRATGIVVIDLSGGFENLSEEHQKILTYAGVDDVISVTYGENTNEIETLTLQVWNDLDVEASGSLAIDADRDVVLQTGGTFRIDHIQAGGDVRLAAGGDILNDNPGVQNIISGGALLFAALSIGEAENPLATDVRYIESESKAGSTWITNTGALTIGGFDGSDMGMTSGGAIILSATSPITAVKDLTALDEIILTAEDSSGPGDDLVIAGGVTVRSMDSYVELRAGDNLIIETGALVQGLGAVRIYGDYGDADPDVGSRIEVSGSVIGNPVEIFGNTDDDVIDASGSAVRVIINGGAGNDTMYGGEGDDLMYGGLGNDFMYGNAGNDEMYGGLGDDTMDGGAGDDGMLGDQGTLVREILDGSSQTTLTISGGVLDEVVNVAGTVRWYATLEDAGAGGNDTMLGGAGNDTVHGGFGDDAISGNEGNDALFGDLGNDTVDGGADSDHMYGGSGDDDMDGGTGNDILYGGDGSDRLVADVEGDRLIDWFGPHNIFVQPKNGYGRPTVIVSPSPWVRQFLLDLAASDGANNPNDEIAVVMPGGPLQKENVGPGTFAATLAEGSVINSNSTDIAQGKKK